MWKWHVSFLLSCVVLTAQSPWGPAIVGCGYNLPAPIYAAPGQLLTFILQGVSGDATQTVRAPAGADLPSTLAGIAAAYSQLPTTPGEAPAILEVHPFFVNSGSNVFPPEYVSLAAVTIQMPFSAQSCPQCPPYGITSGFLVFAQNGVAGSNFDVEPLADQVHILRSCDPFLSSFDEPVITIPSFSGLPCPTIVTHADGSLVSVQNPATAGEEIVAYAVGLGQTNPPLKTGKLVTTAVLTKTTFALDFNYRPNAMPSKPAMGAPPPVFAGATPGYVGLYQVNFVVPPVPPGTSACEQTPSSPQPGQNWVQSNLTVSVGGLFSFDGTRICVAVRNP
jgi:hypothetical protein